MTCKECNGNVFIQGKCPVCGSNNRDNHCVCHIATSLCDYHKPTLKIWLKEQKDSKMILKCEECKDYRSTGAQYQDKKYGKGMRVHNQCNKDLDKKTYRCSICTKTRRID